MSLQKLGLKHNTDKATFHKYLDFYQKLLPKRTFKGRLLEIGVMDGASLKMWREYYPNAEIIGIDIEDKSHLYNDDWKIPKTIDIRQIDGTDTKQLTDLGMFDIIIDDGSHYTADQQKSFEHLYLNQLNPKGFYIIEDLHTSLNPNYVNSKRNTIDYLKHAMIEYEFYHNKANPNDSMTCVIKAGQL